MIIIGSRGSALALAQTSWIKEQLLHRFPDTAFSLKIIKTAGDKDTKASLRAAPAVGVFVKELEHALLHKEIDIAVHSMKDVPTQIGTNLQIAAIPEREDARDALISNSVTHLNELPVGALVGSGSLRRQAQILALRPDLKVMDIRGNLDTRLKKLESGDYDAIILACAGLRRLGLENRISSRFEYTQMLPAPGQGALAVEIRINDTRIENMVATLNHAPTALAVSAERSFLIHMGGGCNVPVAAHACVRQDMIEVDALVSSPDGRKTVRDSVKAKSDQTNEAVAALSDRILSRGGREILNEIL